MIAYIWAQDVNGIIGNNGTLPWRLPDDLQYFKQQTLGQIVVMGRKTFTGMGSRPLPRRTNVVLTRQDDFTAGDHVTVLHDKAGVLAFAEERPDQDLMIIGGAEIFRLFADVVDTLYVTRIAGAFSGDTRMPALPWPQFDQISAHTVVNVDLALTHTFEVWTKNL
ncbi:dihydrofolate reductase [Lacticaseibacillus hulanensis]|uniref:dihydrofolate reductase n=1 Tax=Lacticaseibacillus hulanensis TaxID=2493111 RepID=UPI000FDA3274|nr:dihydrofolate reductase [Lacticaseibacillus hulanensis]